MQNRAHDRIIQNAIAQQRLEGLHVDAQSEVVADARRFLEGKLSMDDVISRINSRLSHVSQVRS